MQLETVWGTVKTRKVSTMLSKQHHVLLKDNIELRPLFEWLKINNLESVKDIKSEHHKKKLIEVLRAFEVKFQVVHDEVMPEIVFSNTIPLEGDFASAIQECLKVFYKMMYNPDSSW